MTSCKNKEFDNLDEYVFSVRSNERFEYFEEVRFKLKKTQNAQIKVAVKIPPVKMSMIIEGHLHIQLDNLIPMHLPLQVKCQVPEIFCCKELFKTDENTAMIKIKAHKDQHEIIMIPFENPSHLKLQLEVGTLSLESFKDRPYDLTVQNYTS